MSLQRAIRPPFLPRACRAGRGRLRASPGSSLDRAGLPTGSFRAPLDSEPLPSGAARSSGILATARRWDPVRVTRTSESLGQCSRRGPRPGPGRGGRRNGRGRGLEKRLGRRLSKRLRKPPDTFTGRGPSAGAARAPRTPSSSGPDPDQSGPGQRPGSAAQCSAHHALAACAASVAKAPDRTAGCHRTAPQRAASRRSTPARRAFRVTIRRSIRVAPCSLRCGRAASAIPRAGRAHQVYSECHQVCPIPTRTAAGAQSRRRVGPAAAALWGAAGQLQFCTAVQNCSCRTLKFVTLKFVCSCRTLSSPGESIICIILY